MFTFLLRSIFFCPCQHQAIIAASIRLRPLSELARRAEPLRVLSTETSFHASRRQSRKIFFRSALPATARRQDKLFKVRALAADPQ
jgi:hypothetical protein